MAKQYLGTKLQELGNVNVLDPTDKIVIVQPKDEGVMELREFFYYVQTNLDLSNYLTAIQSAALYAEKKNVYTKSEADEKFAFIDRTYTKVQSDTKYAPKNDTYSKAESNATFVGIDVTYLKSELYTKDETFTTFALKTEIPILPDLSPYSTTAQGDIRWAMKSETYSKIISDARFAPIDKSYSKAEGDGRFAKILTTYTKLEADAKFLDNDEGYTRQFIQNNIYFKPELYTKLETDTRFALKSNVYTIASVNEQFAAKSWVYSRGEAETTFAPILTTFTKLEVNALVDGQVTAVATNLASNYYTKVNSDAKYATLALTYSRLVSDAKYALISNTLTNVQLIAKYYDKTQVDAKFTAIDWTPYLTKASAATTYATLALTLSKSAIETTYYTKAQVDDAIRAAEQGLTTDSDARYITSGYADGKYSNINSVYTKVHSDATYATLGLTYSVIETDNKFPTKVATTAEIAASKVAITNEVALKYLPSATAASTYITIAAALAKYADKTTVFTKTESDVRFAPMLRSYTKAETDSLYYKNGLGALTLTSSLATGDGSELKLVNTNTTNNEAGRVSWSNHEFEIAHAKVSNTVTNVAEFTLALRPNYITLPVNVLKVTPAHIEHIVYGKLDVYFAKSSESYTRTVIDGLLDTIRNNYLTNATASATYQTIANHTVLNNTVVALDARVTANRTYLDTTFATKALTYSRVESDARYYNSSAESLTINVAASGTWGKGIHLKSTGTSSPLIEFSSSVARSAGIYTTNTGTKGADLITELAHATTGAATVSLKVSPARIWHAVYGDLDVFFAKSADTYTKTESDAKFSSAAIAVYTKAESDVRYGLKTDLTALTGRVTATEGVVSAAKTDLATNYYTKALSYSRVETDARYHDKLGNTLALTQAVGNVEPLNIVFDNTGTTTTLGGLRWTKATDKYTLTVTAATAGVPKLEFSKMTGTATNPILTVDQIGIWHNAYGFLHTYFAKSSESYVKTEIDAKLNLIYSKVQSDANYHNKTVTYTRLETDARYYTKTDADTRYYLKADVFSKLEADARFFDKTESDARYHQKTVTYTRLESDARYINYTDTNVTITGDSAAAVGTGILLKNNNAAGKSGSVRFMSGSGLSGLIFGHTTAATASTLYMYTYSATNAEVETLRLTAAGIWHTAYGELHTYFAKSADYYSKTESAVQYYSKTQTDAAFATKALTYSRIETDTKFYDKVESDGRYYTKAQSDAAYYTKTVGDARYEYMGVAYTKAQSDANYHNKTVTYTRAEMDVRYAYTADAYTKAQSDANYYTKALVYTKVETDARFFDKTESDVRYYTKALGDARYEYMGVAYTKAQGDAKYALKTDDYTKAESDARYYLKADVYTKPEGNVQYVMRSELPGNLSRLIPYMDERQEIEEIKTPGSLAAGWYTIARITYNNAVSGDFEVTALGNNSIFVVKFTVSAAYNGTPVITVTHKDQWSTDYPGITGIEVAQSTSYTLGAIVRIRVPKGATNYTVRLVSRAKTLGNGTMSLLNSMVPMGTTDPTKVIENAAIAPVILANMTKSTTLDLDYGSSAQTNMRMDATAGFLAGPTADGLLVDANNVTWLMANANIATMTASRVGTGETSINIWGRNAANAYATTFTLKATGMWHATYGDLHTYFAKSSEYYSKVESAVQYYSKAQSDANYHNKTVTYTRAEMDVRYAYESTTYTKLQGDARYEYIGIAYTKAQSDANYYTKTVSDGRYAYKADSYTTAVSDGRYYNYTDLLIRPVMNSTDTYSSGIYMNNIHATSDAGSSVVWATRGVRSAMLFTTGGSATDSTLQLYLRNTGGVWSQGMRFNTTGVWHIAYGDLHTYFAKTTELAAAVGSINSLNNSITALTNNVYTKVVSDGKYALKTDDYTKAESDARYYLRADVYTKAQSDANYYTKAVSDGRYAYKADSYLKSQTYSQAETHSVAQANARFAYKADSYLKSETYTKTEVDTRTMTQDRRSTNDTPAWYLANRSMMKSVEFKTGNVIGLTLPNNYGGLETNVYYADASGNYPVQSVQSVDNRFYIRSGITATAWSAWVEMESINGAAAKYYAKALVYTKAETDAKFYDAAQSNARFAYKADSYTTAVSDGRYAYKADAYTKAQSDGRYAYKADAYTKAQSDANYYTKTVSDGRYAYKADSYTRAQSDANYYTKAVSDARYIAADKLGSVGLGISQRWVDYKASRVKSTLYTNTTARTIIVSVSLTNNSSHSGSLGIAGYVDNIMIDAMVAWSSGVGYISNATLIVPPGSTYKVDGTGNHSSYISTWAELR